MSWNNIYPFLTDEMLADYQARVTSDEEKEMDEWLAVAKTFNRQKGNHMVVTSLCHHPGKGLNVGNKPISDSPSSLQGSSVTRGRFELDQLLEGAYAIKATRPQVILRVYLAADMAEFVDLLVAAGFEVFLMRGSASMVKAASLWRFLALEEEGRCTTFTHGRFGVKMIHDVERTEHLVNLPQGLWRSPYIVGDKSQRLEARSYRPIEPDHFGTKDHLPAGLLMRALIWHCRKGSMPARAMELSGHTSYPIEGSQWPSDQFDSWFLMSAVFPRLAFGGVLTCLIWHRKALNCWYTLDIEYVTWANPNSEVILIGRAISPEAPWLAMEESGGITLRPDTLVVRRERKSVLEFVEKLQPGREILSFLPFDGSLDTLLAWSVKHATGTWWVDFNPTLRISPTGAEVFLDRRYERADVVVCGFFFARITAEIAAVAAGLGLDSVRWSEGSIRKLPKLEGPLTLWRTEFTKEFLAALKREKRAKPEFLLSAWTELGKATVMISTAKKMGWNIH